MLCSENVYKFGNILPGMRRKVNISTLMVFRIQSNSNNTAPSIGTITGFLPFTFLYKFCILVQFKLL